MGFNTCNQRNIQWKKGDFSCTSMTIKGNWMQGKWNKKVNELFYCT